ncbi:MAG TPA: cation transporter [Bacillota bacterium]|nr:cation transporter [Bacillota bacterium]HOK69421.1 cation transporter [Bacillota bacterium]HPP86035.1 cation transporter [Bacillota bacterium]
MTKNYKLTDVCPTCARKLEEEIKKIDGVLDAKISVISEKLVIDCDGEDLQRILKEVKKACKKVEPDCVLYAD